MEHTESLPAFRYHPDPLATGAVESGPDAPCASCQRIRGYKYTGPVYSTEDLPIEQYLCPWCIADGSAARQFGATFNDTGETDGLSDPVRSEIETRTPGFTGWQQERWLACCGDAAAFLGAAGAAELRRSFPAAVPVVKKYLRDEFDLSQADAEQFFRTLDRESGPTAYVFLCLHCGGYLAYVDQA